MIQSAPGIGIYFSGLILCKTSGKTKKKIGGRHPEGDITDLSNERIEEKTRRMKATSEEGQGPEGAVAPKME